MNKHCRLSKLLLLVLAAGTSSFSLMSLAKDSPQDNTSQASETAGKKSFIPNIKDNDTAVTVSKGNYVAAPIPFSNPTIDSGLAGVFGYFYPQDAHQKANQPPSVTGIGAMYSSNKSYAAAVGHASYWDDNNWQFKGGVGYADLKLPLISSDENNIGFNLNWDLKGVAALAEINRQFAKNWYVGLTGIYLDLKQQFSVDISSIHFELGNEVQSFGLGPAIIYDSRDVPTNAYDGYYFKAETIIYDKAIGSENEFTSYNLEVDGYHPLREDLVVAWKLKGCAREGDIPLWAACRLGLRGFASTEFMSRQSLETEAEARWRFHKRWGMVAFAGLGALDDTHSRINESEVIPSYGVGLRWMIQPAERINIRLDYARSNDNNQAVYLSVGEAF
ncbi:BamA/TamA family outer membrane protein [Shewanella gaetbuli]|uniref:Outer membrane protein assembly factor n=1 Tax=Shewanella gaetbuli TaxID=220752 RepID=A0A9X1ZIP0_9GAMM|nr:BamA/TamA family outer membrane protein [Shewanella gaetbuli]MCL1142403.1 outer membrane protein assembly factor [Shewanella gaetbuli]